MYSSVFVIDKVRSSFHIAKYKINGILARSSSKSLTFRQWHIMVSIKDGAYYCYCAYVLRTSRYSGFPSVTLANTEIFLQGLKLSGETGSY